MILGKRGCLLKVHIEIFGRDQNIAMQALLRVGMLLHPEYTVVLSLTPLFIF